MLNGSYLVSVNWVLNIRVKEMLVWVNEAMLANINLLHFWKEGINRATQHHQNAWKTMEQDVCMCECEDRYNEVYAMDYTQGKENLIIFY